jgi:hypothetical protein
MCAYAPPQLLVLALNLYLISTLFLQNSPSASAAACRHLCRTAVQELVNKVLSLCVSPIHHKSHQCTFWAPTYSRTYQSSKEDAVFCGILVESN